MPKRPNSRALRVNVVPQRDSGTCTHTRTLCATKGTYTQCGLRSSGVSTCLRPSALRVGLLLSLLRAILSLIVIYACFLISPVGSYYFATASHDRTVSHRVHLNLDSLWMPILAASFQRMG